MYLKDSLSSLLVVVVSIWLTLVCRGCDNWALTYLGLWHFFGEKTHNSEVITVLTPCGAYLTRILTPALTTISIKWWCIDSFEGQLDSKWSLSLLPVVQGAIVFLEIVNNIYLLIVCLQAFVDLLLILSPHLQIDWNFKSFLLATTSL